MYLFITKAYKDDNKDYAENEDLPRCYCGSKPFISRNIVDGFYMGWSVGCPRYCINDGIHNNPKKPLTKFYLNNKTECKKWWKNRTKLKDFRDNDL